MQKINEAAIFNLGSCVTTELSIRFTVRVCRERVSICVRSLHFGCQSDCFNS